MGIFKRNKNKSSGSASATKPKLFGKVKEKINKERENNRTSRRSLRNFGDARKENKARRQQNRANKKADRRENGWFARWQKNRSERVALRQAGKNTRAADGGSFAEVVGNVGGIIGELIRPDGTQHAFQTNWDGTQTNLATGAVYQPNPADTVIVDEKLKTELTQRNVQVEDLKFKDVNNDFIDDETGKYIWQKKKEESMLGYIWRLMSHENSPWYWRLGSILVVIAAVFSLFKWVLMPVWKWLKKKLRF